MKKLVLSSITAMVVAIGAFFATNAAYATCPLLYAPDIPADSSTVVAILTIAVVAVTLAIIAAAISDFFVAAACLAIAAAALAAIGENITIFTSAAAAGFACVIAEDLGIKWRWVLAIIGIESLTVLIVLLGTNVIENAMIGLVGVALVLLFGYLGRNRARPRSTDG